MSYVPKNEVPLDSGKQLEQQEAQKKAWEDPFSTWNARNLIPKKD